MARLRQTPCIHYKSKGVCDLGRDAEHNGYCQKCAQYNPRAKVRYVNIKKKKLDKLRKKDFDGE